MKIIQALHVLCSAMSTGPTGTCTCIHVGYTIQQVVSNGIFPK